MIAATQVDLDESINSVMNSGLTLYWRLNVIHVHVFLPLQERREDIVYLARLFVTEQAAKTWKRKVLGLSKEAELQLQSHAIFRKRA